MPFYLLLDARITKMLSMDYIVADKWILTLWQGIGLIVVRAMALNMEMLASYDQSVEFFKDFLSLGETSTVMGPNVVSGFFASAFSLPFDYVKTQIQRMQPDASGKYPYTSSLDRAMKTLKYGGPLKFHIGFPVHCVRIAPYVMLTWIFLLEPNLEVGRIHGVVNLINAKKC